MINKKYWIILLVYFVVSLLGLRCTQKDCTYTTIKVNPTMRNKNIEINLEIDTIISLETIDSSLIGRIGKIEYYKSRFYVLDEYYSENVFVFDSIGNFVTKTKKGRGPGEIGGTTSFEIDKVKNEVKILDHITYHLNFYDLDLNFKRRFKYHNIVRSITTVNDSIYLAFVRISGNEPDELDRSIPSYNFMVYDDSLSVILDRIGPMPRPLARLHVAVPMSRFEDEIIYSCLYKYDIYSFKNMKSELKYKIDFGKYGLSNEEIEKGIDYIWEKRKENQKITALNFLFQNKKFITFSYSLNDRVNWNIISKSNNRKISSNDFTEQEFPVTIIVGTSSFEKLIGVVNPKDMMKYLKNNNKVEEANKINMMDNPYLIIFKPKLNE